MSVRYSGSNMSLPEQVDPIRLTRELVEIESTTYHEGRVGDFLAGFLAGRGWTVEKTPVPQPTESATAGPRWNIYSGPTDRAPDLVFSTHLDTVPPVAPIEPVLVGGFWENANEGILGADNKSAVAIARSCGQKTTTSPAVWACP